MQRQVIMATAAYPKSADLREPVFRPDNPGFREDFDSKPFEFQHSFDTAHPLFQMDRVRQLLTNPETKTGIYYDAGDIRVDQRWDAVPARNKPVEEVFDSLDNAGAWIILRRVHKDPQYNEILEECLAEVKRLSGRAIDEDKKSQEAMIFLTSPARVTAYHIDRECNFLMQVSGEKQISVFDRNDREVVPDQELETFWSKDNNAGVYKPQFQDRASVYTMRPGTGVHIPVNCPHWLKNGNNVSISLSISYQYQDSRRKNVYQANYYLRKLGLKPTPPGASPFLDSLKGSAITAGLAVKSRLKRSPATH
jgi:hypothetical protein